MLQAADGCRSLLARPAPQLASRNAYIGSGAVASFIVSLFFCIGLASEAAWSAALGNVEAKAATAADGFRFLTQASFGPTAAELARIQTMGVEAYLEDQFTAPASGYPDSQYTYLSLKVSDSCNNKDPLGNAYPA